MTWKYGREPEKSAGISCWVGWSLHSSDYLTWYLVHRYCSGLCAASWEVPSGASITFCSKKFMETVQDLSGVVFLSFHCKGMIISKFFPLMDLCFKHLSYLVLWQILHRHSEISFWLSDIALQCPSSQINHLLNKLVRQLNVHWAAFQQGRRSCCYARSKIITTLLNC